jgi:pimeloyl-ACP methyl ester carboxylesterase
MFNLTKPIITALAAATLLSSCAITNPTPAPKPPIVFVHGNGDTAALWLTTLWRFESNGWPTDRLHAIEVPYPNSRDEDNKPQAGRTSSTEHRDYLKAEVEKVLKATGAAQVVLIGNSRGGNAIRNYIQTAGGDKTVSHAILGGTPNHGVWATKGFREANEFSGTGPFLTGLNAPKNAAGDEVAPPVKWMTIRSDNNDKFAQPDGLWIGAKGTPTNVTFAGPELKGALNVVIPKIDHRETSFSKAAFEASYRFITGLNDAKDIAAQSAVRLSGTVTGLGLSPTDPASGAFVNNLPLAGAQLQVFATGLNGERLGAELLNQTIAANGAWALNTVSTQALEFVITAPGYANTHIYRSPFTRSSSIVNLRAERLSDADKADAAAKAVVNFSRPRGYFDLARDTVSFDGGVPPGLPAAGAGLSISKIKVANESQRPIVASFNGERVVGQTWPKAQGHTVTLELHY